MRAMDEIQDEGTEGTPSPRAALQVASQVQRAAGLSRTPMPGYQPIGTDLSGRPQFASTQLLKAQDPNAGNNLTQVTSHVLNHLGAFSTPAEKDNFDQVGRTASDSSVHAELDRHAANNDPKAFMNTALQAFGYPTSSRANATKSQGRANVGVGAASLYPAWSALSPTQKSVALASLGVKGFQSGGNLLENKVLKGGDDSPRITVGQSMDLMKRGVNAAPLVKNWDQASGLADIAGSGKDAGSVASLSHGLGLLGQGPDGETVGSITPDKLQSMGYRPAPQFGVGAIHSPSRISQVPQGYSLVHSSQAGTVAVPKGNMGSAQGALQGSLIGTSAGQDSVSQSASKLYSSWDPKEPTKGLVGGNAMAGGLYNLKNGSPYLAGGNAVRTLYSNVGKSGLNHGSDAETVAGMGGIALSRLQNGDKSKSTDMDGVSTARNAISQSQQKDIPGVTAALKAQYSQAGIKSKSDAYQLSNQAYAEGRINESDLAAMHHTYDMIFDGNGADLAQNLMTGKEKGFEAIKGAPDTSMVRTSVRPQMRSKEEIIAQNRARYQGTNVQGASNGV